MGAWHDMSRLLIINLSVLMRYLTLVICSLLVIGLSACGGDSDGGGGGEDLQTVEENDVELTLPPGVPAGRPFEVRWSGPDAQGDYLAVAQKGADDDKTVAYTYTRSGSPLSLRPPDTPGDFEVRYITGENDDVLASAPLRVREVDASIDAPAKIGAGTPIEISWKGPDNPNDYISIAEKGTEDDASANYTYTRSGTPLTVRAPDTPGAYELRYVMAQSDRVIARHDVSVTSVSASFDVADTLMVNTPVEVNWEGPNNPNDYVSIAEKGTPDDESTTYTYTRQGNPLTIRTPERPGQYELRYVMAQSDRAVARHSLVILPLQARLRAPDSVQVGKSVEVSWIGPNGPDDFIAVSSLDSNPTDYESRALSRAGKPATVYAPNTPGSFELRYVWAEKDSILNTVPLTVTEKN